ncbi:MAG: type II toxin-antitoxin system VapC family toxin [Candidatus Eremiobacteraeota bacterium]|nr:type II toxin-antitoxin system VapC family toxin [Candidatus Eremiobacteraeota bacterium]
MDLLLDTHAFLRAAADPSKLSRNARAAIGNPANNVFVSAAVAWEITIKRDLGKIVLPLNPAMYVPTRLSMLGFKPLPITQEHALAVNGLPKLHKDPFDRIMIAQAQVEGCTFVTDDAASLHYPVHILKAT